MIPPAFSPCEVNVTGRRTIIQSPCYGEVTYGRHYLQARRGGGGFFPLDEVLGLTRDRLTPWVMQWVARLAAASGVTVTGTVTAVVMVLSGARWADCSSLRRSYAAVRQAVAAWEATSIPPKGLPRVLRRVRQRLTRADPQVAQRFWSHTGARRHLP